MSNRSEQFNTQAKEATLHDYLAVLYRGRWLIICSFVLMVGLVAYYTFTVAPTYEASATIMIDEQQGMGQSLFDVSGFSQQRTLINNQVQILKSRALHYSALQRLLQSDERDSLQLFTELGQEQTMTDVLLDLRKAVNVNPIRDTDLISINVRAGSPFEAAFIANTIIETYQSMDQNMSRGEISQVVSFLDEQLRLKEQDLKESEEKLKKFLEVEKIASLTDEASQIVLQSATFESLYKEAKIDLQAGQRRLEYLKGLLGRSQSKLVAEIARVSSPLVLQFRMEMAGIERTIAVYLSQGVDDTDVQVRRERDKLEAIKRRLNEETRKIIIEGLPPNDPLAEAQGLVVQIIEVETELASFEAKAEGLQRVVENYSSELESLPDKNVQLARMERNKMVDENLYMMMREKYEESRITKAGQIGKVRILDEAVPPVYPISPKKKLNLFIGVILGLGLGMGITFFREYLDASIRRVEDIEELGLTVLAAIPRMNQDELTEMADSSQRRADGTRDESHRLVTHLNPKSPISEAYRTLRTNLQFSSTADTVRSFLVTSAGPGEGKSTTTANLAIAMSLQGTRTILVDTDLRKPVVHKIFGVDKNRGLTNVLIGKMEASEAIQKSKVTNLDVMPAGILPPNPAELLGSDKMKELVAELRGSYDMCLFDSPPLIAVTDAAVLSKELDGILLVVKSGHTHRDALMRGLELVRNVDSRILGVLLNDVSRENTYGSSYYYYNNYYYAGDNDGKKRRKRKKTRKVELEEVHTVEL